MNGEKQVEQDQEGLEYYLAHDELWPWFPILPVKRYIPSQSWPESGVIWAGHPTTVILTGIFGLTQRVLGFDEAVAQYVTDTYENPAAMAAAGWVID